MGVLRPYTINYTMDVAAVGNGNVYLVLNNLNRAFKLRSVLFDVQIIESLSGKVYPLDSNITQQFALYILAMPLTGHFAQTFDITSGNGIVENDGDGITIYAPGQYIFNSLNTRDNLKFNFLYNNNDAALAYTYNFNCFVEVEDMDFVH